jgi:hypothetical protein
LKKLQMVKSQHEVDLIQHSVDQEIW